RWTAPEQPPVLTAQDLPQVFHVPVDRLHVRVAPVIEDFEVLVGGMELAIEPLGTYFGYELRRLAQEVEARRVLHLSPAIGSDRERHATENELGIEAIPALLQVTTVGHLGDHVGGAQQVSYLDVPRIGDLDL